MSEAERPEGSVSPSADQQNPKGLRLRDWLILIALAAFVVWIIYDMPPGLARFFSSLFKLLGSLK